jgi:DNA ligase-1
LHAWFFDVLLAGDESLVDRPYRERRALLERIVPASHIVPAHVPADAAEAQRLYDDALGHGHEGVLMKALDSVYAAGRRGSQWLKVKPATTLDLVILAAEWGHGRRRGVLSNLHLGARMPESPGRFAMLGKTFKGLTDAMLREMTEDLLGLAVQQDDFVVHVRPERVVEIAFDAVQRSPRYDSGLALRFARVKRFRPDKSAADASTLDDVRAVQARQSGSV